MIYLICIWALLGIFSSFIIYNTLKKEPNVVNIYKTNKMIKQGRVITTDYNVVQVVPVANEANELALCCAAVDSEGNLYVWGSLKHFLPNEKHIINQCWDDDVSDEDFINSTKRLYN